MRVLRVACSVVVIFLALQVVASGGGGPARAATVEDPANYTIEVSCGVRSTGGSHCFYIATVDGGDLPIRAVTLPAEALCGDIVDTNLVAGDGGAMVAESDWATIDFADDVTTDSDLAVTYLFTVGESDDDATTVEVPGIGLQCTAAPAAIGLTVRTVRADNHGTLLPDACYALYEGDDGGSPLAGPTCDADDGAADGIVAFDDVPMNSDLMVVETQPPAGYQQAADQVVETVEQSLVVNIEHESKVVAMSEVLVIGLICNADPGALDPQDLLERRLPDGCVQAQAVVYDMTADGDPVATSPLLADIDGVAQASVPTGSQVVISMQPLSGLPDITPQENPIMLDDVQPGTTPVIFLYLRGVAPSPSPSPSTSPSPDVSPSPSPDVSPSPSPSTAPSSSPDPNASPSPGASTGPAVSPSSDPSTGAAPSPPGGSGGLDPGQTTAPGSRTGQPAVAPGHASQVTQLPETGGWHQRRGDRLWLLGVLLAALGTSWLGWRAHRQKRPGR